MTRRLLLTLLAAAASASSAQTVEGTVTSAGEPVALATVRVLGTAVGVAAEADGAYRLDLPGPGAFVLEVSAVGYVAVRHEVTVAPGETVSLHVEIAAATYDAGAVVVTGTLQHVAVRESPVKVDVLPARFLEMTPSASVMDAIKRVNGLYQQIDCGVCYTNNIRINGIEGPNTAVLIDGMPVMSSRATA